MITNQIPRQSQQLESFWNLIQASDEEVQLGLHILLMRKYSKEENQPVSANPSFLQMKGILRGKGDTNSDRQALNDYLTEKYGV